MAMLLLLLACTHESRVWVSHEDGASVGVSTGSGRVLAYVCGTDDQTRQDWTRWFSGELVDGGFEIERDGWQLRGVPLNDVFEVEIDGPAGEADSWVAAEELAGGVYEHDGDCRDGAIAGAGEVVGTWCDRFGTRHQVEPADTLVDWGDRLDLVALGERMVFERVLP